MLPPPPSSQHSVIIETLQTADLTNHGSQDKDIILHTAIKVDNFMYEVYFVTKYIFFNLNIRPAV